MGAGRVSPRAPAKLAQRRMAVFCLGSYAPSSALFLLACASWHDCSWRCRIWLTRTSKAASYHPTWLHTNLTCSKERPCPNIDQLVNSLIDCGNPAVAPKEPPSRIGWMPSGNSWRSSPRLAPIHRPAAGRTNPPPTRMPNGRPRQHPRNRPVAAVGAIRITTRRAEECP